MSIKTWSKFIVRYSNKYSYGARAVKRLTTAKKLKEKLTRQGYHVSVSEV